MEHKTCPHCLRSLPADAFYATHGWCKECDKAAVRERRKDGPPYRRPRRPLSEEEKARRREYARAYYRNLPPERKAAYIRKASESSAARQERMFGGRREATVRRDGESCQTCGMTRQAHVEQFGYDLDVHHVNGRGRRSACPDNCPENLLTLCHACHARLHRQAGGVSR